jgi:IS605 OrfB family transposase
MISVIHGELYSEDFSKLEQLSKDYCSCVRFCYNQFHKNKDIEFNDVRKSAKIKYKNKLNTRQISDSTVQGKAIKIRFKEQSVVFGGKKLFEQLRQGKISKQEWQYARDYSYYARGDRNQKGNPDIRIVDDTLKITVGNRQFEYYKLFIPNKYKEKLQKLVELGIAYNIRLKRKDDKHWKVAIDYQTPNPEVTINFDKGAIGIDTNIDRIAITEINKDGNYIDSQTIINSRLKDGSTNKRNYDIGCIVKQIINIAKEKNKGIVFENLKFKKDNIKSKQKPKIKVKNKFIKKRNRTFSNFVWNKFLTLLENKCIENGIAFKKVNPAFTTVIGKVKYSQLYKITAHESAAYVIARRGLNFNEKVSVHNCPSKLVKEVIIRKLGEKYDGKRINNWVFWSKIKAVLPGLKNKMRNLKELRDYFLDKSENLLSKTFHLELVDGS